MKKEDNLPWQHSDQSVCLESKLYSYNEDNARKESLSYIPRNFDNQSTASRVPKDLVTLKQNSCRGHVIKQNSDLRMHAVMPFHRNLDTASAVQHNKEIEQS